MDRQLNRRLSVNTASTLLKDPIGLTYYAHRKFLVLHPSALQIYFYYLLNDLKLFHGTLNQQLVCRNFRKANFNLDI